VFSGVNGALAQVDTQLRLFGKPRVEGHRRVAVTLALGESIDQARERARKAASELHIELR
jgi:phosphoribosylglycinamide formyltransferase 2